jgi:hypothetical protein
MVHELPPYQGSPQAAAKPATWLSWPRRSDVVELGRAFRQWKVQMQVEAIEAFCVDDLLAFFNQLKER